MIFLLPLTNIKPKHMKKALLNMGVIILFINFSTGVFAQQNKISGFNINADLYSSFIWRGSKFGTGPHFQPSMKFKTGGFTAGVWGTFDMNGYSETDPYVLYEFPFGLSMGITDYYYPGMKLSDISVETGSHAFELNGCLNLKSLSLSANYIINEAGGAGTKGQDMYFQAGWSFDHFNVFAGCGNGWHTSTGKFNVCNIGIGTGKNIRITESFSIPVTGQVIINPEREQMFIVAGFSF
jgi:hypothetical protein